MIRRPPRSPLFPSPPLSGSPERNHPSRASRAGGTAGPHAAGPVPLLPAARIIWVRRPDRARRQEVEERSEEHTSELQSQSNLVCRLLLEKKKKDTNTAFIHV